ncbi:MAG: Holliday junction resolvase RuvX [Gemmatimonadetes bacterium]|nr:Holliday junction resolvase RuvX [Gemmatimonadota bacterium]
MSGRWVGIDLGDRRIGVAVSDPTGFLAEGRDTLDRSGESFPWRAIEAVLEEADARGVVVGEPLNMDGSAGERAELSRRFAAELHERTGVRVELQDERLTSVQAQRMLIETRPGGGGKPGGKKSKKKSKGKRKEDVDQVAAVLILQAWLDRNARDGG